VHQIALAGRQIGPDFPCFVIAEAGVNHNGEVKLAHRLIDAAADAGVDAVKFQTFDPDQVAAPAAVKADYQIEATGEEGAQLDMLRRLTLPPPAYRELARHAADRGLIFLSTPFDRSSADFLRELGVPAFKVSSGDVTNHPFLEHLARAGLPLLLSTGMSTLEEVARAVEVIRACGASSLALFHCVSNYPAAPGDCNLRAMETMRSAFGAPVGWSDHTDGIDISIAAVALGANLLEKHFTLDRNLPGPDHKASLEPDELRDMVSAIRRVEAALGDGVKRPVEAEIPIAVIGRRSLFWRTSLPVGALVTPDNLTALRPATGISPAEQASLVGRRLARAVQAGEAVQWDDFPPPQVQAADGSDR
jgi:N-acetylneuraminate synthase/N,N'-diacetyllegionaminate synthase